MVVVQRERVSKAFLAFFLLMTYEIVDNSNRKRVAQRG